jgi:multidrug transporter EmrE-like cation transporter
MKIVSEVYSEVGKASVNAGLGFLLAALVALLFTKEPIEWWKFPVGIVLVLAHIFIGAWFIQIAHRIKERERQNDG